MSSPPSSPVRSLPTYRPAKIISSELREHCIIYFEEGLYAQALNLLNALLVSGSQSHSLIPAPPLLALLTTLSIYPSFTDPSSSADKIAAADQALHYLHSLNRIVGPVNADLCRAFHFVEKRRAASGRNVATTRHSREAPLRQSAISEIPSGELSTSTRAFNEVEDGLPNSKLASHRSLWACADDFWHTVGWSFNCAAVFTARWKRWRIWLEMMLDMIEDDWTYRMQQAGEQGDSEVLSDKGKLTESLAFHFLRNCGGGSNGAARRRVLRAVFANGTEKDLSEFREIFRDETKPKKKSDDTLHTFRDVDIAAGRFGDYYDEDNSEAERDDELGASKDEQSYRAQSRSSNPRYRLNQPRVRSRQITPSPDRRVAQFGGLEIFGSHEAVVLRRRLLIILSRVSLAIPSEFVEISTFIDVLEEFIRPLPLSVYSFLLSPTPGIVLEERASWPSSALISLLQELARQLLPASAPRHKDNYLTQRILEKYYLPFPARSNLAVDNAKLSLLAENMIRLLQLHASISADEGDFREMVEKGIKERKKKVQTRSKNDKDEVGLEAFDFLETSTIRLRMLVEVIEEFPSEERT